MQQTLTPTLDHLGWICADLAPAATNWERLGFTLTRVSPQMGFTGPGGALEPWASANRCAVFETGYLELIGLVDPKRHNPWKSYLARGDGPHIAAFRVGAADDAYPPLAARVDGFDLPVQRWRMAPLGVTDDGGETEMRFRNIFSRDDAWPEGRFIVIEHQTPDALWQPDLQVHANGAEALVEAVFSAPDPGPTTERLERLLDRPATSVSGGRQITAAGGGRVTVLATPAFAHRFPGATAPERPAVGAAVVKVSSLDAVVGLAARAGVGLRQEPDGAFVAAGADTGGGAIAFVEHA